MERCSWAGIHSAINEMQFTYREQFLQDVGVAEDAELCERLPQRYVELTVSI